MALGGRCLHLEGGEASLTRDPPLVQSSCWVPSLPSSSELLLGFSPRTSASSLLSPSPLSPLVTTSTSRGLASFPTGARPLRSSMRRQHTPPHVLVAAAIVVGAMAGALYATSRKHTDAQQYVETTARLTDALEASSRRIAQLEAQINNEGGNAAEAAAQVNCASSSASTSPFARSDDLRAYETDLPNEPLPQNLLDAVQRYAKNKEIMIAFANDVMMCTNTKTCWWNGGNVLASFLDVIDTLHISNYLILSLDDNTHAYLESRSAHYVPFIIEVPSAQEGSHPANQISTLKYKTVAGLLAKHYSVLISDLDLVYIQNPFDHLHRDADIEVQSDGFSTDWAFGKLSGVHDPEMGWGGGGLYVDVFTLNVGCGYFRPTRATIDLLMRVYKRLAQAKAWDQQVFNEELSLKPLKGVSYRVMDPHVFANSKPSGRAADRATFLGSVLTIATRQSWCT